MNPPPQNIQPGQPQPMSPNVQPMPPQMPQPVQPQPLPMQPPSVPAQVPTSQNEQATLGIPQQQPVPPPVDPAAEPQVKLRISISFPFLFPASPTRNTSSYCSARRQYNLQALCSGSMQCPCNLRGNWASAEGLLTGRRWSDFRHGHPGLQKHWQRAGMLQGCVVFGHFSYFPLKTPTVEAKVCKWGNERLWVGIARRWPIFVVFPLLTMAKMEDSLAMAKTLWIQTIWSNASLEVQSPDVEGFEATNVF